MAQAGSSSPLLEAASTERIPEPRRCVAFCDYSESANPRDAHLDNLKGLMALSVVYIHLAFGLLVAFSSTKSIGSIPGKFYMGVYSLLLVFTMPAFSFVSGYVSTPNMNSAQRTNLLRYFVTWLIQHALFYVLLVAPQEGLMEANQWKDEHPNLKAINTILEAEGKPTLSPPSPVPIPFFYNAGLDWYIWCVIIWRCFLPLLERLRLPIIFSVATSIVMMFTDSYERECTNTVFGFLPFFLLGYHFKARKDELMRIRESSTHRAIFIAFGIMVVLWSFVDGDSQAVFVSFSLGCLYGGEIGPHMRFTPHQIAQWNMTDIALQPFKDPHFCQSGPGVVHTLFFYRVSMLAVLGVTTVVPKEKIYLLTRAGQNSIYIYFGQVWFIVLVIILVGLSGSYGNTALPAYVSVALGFVLSLATWAILAQPCFKCLCSPCIEPKVEKGFLAIVAQGEKP
eukprot:TRINITY_DN12255_c0_g1_i2.p1 TRINITY_DN12255_c0_g1~~TRINITY_DN12255_c0_g1_i2.p1  ORF type:complete len:452 (+),score=22.18 TRINITY_DN12255_c0_g1_i2:59-1414(+)